MSSSSLSSLSSSFSLDSVRSQPQDLINGNFIPSTASSSRASSTAPTDIDPLAPTASSHKSARSRRKTRSTPVTQTLYGPQHLELEYSRAYEELRSATIYALYRLGYTNPKRKTTDGAVEIPTLPMVLAAKFPDVERARERLNQADKKISEALEMGHTWENTPWPASRANVPKPPRADDGCTAELDLNGPQADVNDDNEDGSDEDDNDEKEIREIWARFLEKESRESSAKAVLNSATSASASSVGRRKRNQDSQDVIPSDRRLRRRVEPSISAGSAEIKRTLPGRRAALRSSKVIRAH